MICLALTFGIHKAHPTLRWVQGFARGCYTEGYNWALQLCPISSYAPIRIWKIDPFVYCPEDASGNSESCGVGLVSYADVPDAFTEIIPVGEDGTPTNVFSSQKCNVPFAVSVVGMEHIDDENIAVTVLRASFSDFSVDTGLIRPDATNATYRTYFLSTETMAMGDVPWNRDTQLAASNAAEGKLCPAMRRLPNLGSMGAEVAVAGVELVRKAVDIILVLPAFTNMWERQETCPLVTHGHTLMLRCGSDLLSLDNFFDALNRANAHFWRSFSIVAERVRDLGVDRIANLIDGVAYYGESTISPTDVYSSFVRAMRIPTSEISSQIVQAVVPMADRYVCSLTCDKNDRYFQVHGERDSNPVHETA